MIDQPPHRPSRRILAAFHPSTTSRTAIDAAVDLALHLRAELSAMFIEDATLLSLSEYPFLRQIGVHGAISRGQERQAFKDELRAFARQAERYLAKSANQRRVRWSFTTAHGQIEDQIKAIGGPADLLIVESSSRPIGRVMQLEASARRLARLAGGSVLMIHPTQRLAGPIHAIIEAASDAAKMTAAAAEIADRFDCMLDLHLVAADKSARQTLDRIIQDHPDDVAARTKTETIPAIDRQELHRVLELSRGGIVVLSADSAILAEDAAWNVIARAPCAVLLVR
ncbi:MAG: universal stress protein [Geminicoccaceae bacterium]